MSPEQVRGGDIDRRTDIFALGILLYELTTGKHPFRGENDVATLYNVTSESPVYPPSKLVPRLSAGARSGDQESAGQGRQRALRDGPGSPASSRRRAPESQRLTTDSEVAAFVRALLGDRHEQRQKALKTALRLADERALGRHASSPNQLEVISHSGFTPPSNVSGLVAPPGLRSVYPRGRHPSDASPASMSTGAMTTTDQKGTLDGEVFSVRPSGGRRVALAAFLIVLAGGAGLFAAFRSNMPGFSSQPDPMAATLTPLAPSAPSPAPSTTASAVPTEVASAAATPEPAETVAPAIPAKPDAGVVALVPPRLPYSPFPHAAPPKPAPPAPPPATPPPAKPASTSFMPPVRNPGF